MDVGDKPDAAVPSIPSGISIDVRLKALLVLVSVEIILTKALRFPQCILCHRPTFSI